MPFGLTEPQEAAELQDGLPPARRRGAVIALTCAMAMATLDLAIANTALPTIAVDLHTSPAASVWVINAYQLAVAATVLPIASFAEIFGQKRVYVIGLALFVLASVACALSWSLPSLVAARMLQGLGGSAVMGVNTAMLRAVHPEARFGRGLGFNTLVVAVSFAVGPTVASAILSVAHWPMLFAINLPIGLVAFVFAWRTLPDTPRGRHRFDGLNALLTAGVLGLLVLVLAQSAQRQGGPDVAIELVVLVVCFLLVLRRQQGQLAPIMPIDLFRRPVFALSALTAVGAFATQGLAFVALPFYFEAVMHRSQVATGFLMTPWPVVVALAGPIAGRLVDRYPAGILGGIGLAILSFGMFLLATMPAEPSAFASGWRMVICGAGFGLFQSPNLKAIMGSAPRERGASASGIVATARLLGQALGAALVAFCLGIGTQVGPTVALWCGVAFAALASIASFLRLLPARG